MILYPAIDLKDGICVRLMHGRFDAVTRYDDQPAARLTNRRADLIKALDAFGDTDLEAFVDGWYSDETQSVLRGLFEKK